MKKINIIEYKSLIRLKTLPIKMFCFLVLKVITTNTKKQIEVNESNLYYG